MRSTATTSVALISFVSALTISTSLQAWEEPVNADCTANAQPALVNSQVVETTQNTAPAPCPVFAGNTLAELSSTISTAASAAGVDLGTPVGNNAVVAPQNNGQAGNIALGAPVGSNVNSQNAGGASVAGGQIPALNQPAVNQAASGSQSASQVSSASNSATSNGDEQIFTIGNNVVQGTPELVSTTTTDTSPAIDLSEITTTFVRPASSSDDVVEATEVEASTTVTGTTRAFPTLWSYLGGGVGFQRFSFEDKTGARTANLKTANLTAGIQYKKLVGIEGRVGFGIGSEDLSFDCGYKHRCDLSVRAPLFASVLGRLQYASNASITPYILAGGAYSKIEATLTDSVDTQVEESSGFGFAYGAGVEFMASEKIRVGLEYLRQAENLSSFGATARYVF